MGMASLLWIGIGYLLGSVPFELLLTRANGIDIRAVGSGNIGTTNVLRTGNEGLAATTLLLDAGKGAAAVLAALPDLAQRGGRASPESLLARTLFPEPDFQQSAQSSPFEDGPLTYTIISQPHCAQSVASPRAERLSSRWCLTRQY